MIFENGNLVFICDKKILLCKRRCLININKTNVFCFSEKIGHIHFENITSSFSGSYANIIYKILLDIISYNLINQGGAIHNLIIP